LLNLYKPLAVHHNHASPQSILHGYHTAVRISPCGHIHGQECLDAWLGIGNSCPTYKRILFELTGDPIAQQDVNGIVIALSPEYGESRVMAVVADMVQKQERVHTMICQIHEEGIMKQKMKEDSAQNDGFMLSDDDFVDSDEEMDFGEEIGGEEYVAEEEETEGFAG
jgi:hypothetical protein